MTLTCSWRTVIGVDIGRRTIKAVQLHRTAHGYRAAALALLPRPEAEADVSSADAQALRNVLRRLGFSGKRIVVAAPDAALMRATLELPAKVSGAPVDQIVRMELSRLYNAAPETFEMTHWEMKTPEGAKPMTQTLAIGCPHDAADALLDIFEDSGFDVTALDVRSAAAVRACGSLLMSSPAITAIADVGWRATSVLFVCGRSLVYERVLEGSSMSELTGRLTEAFGISSEGSTQVINTVGLSAEAGIETLDRTTLDAVRRHLRLHFDRLLEEMRVPLSYAHHQFPGDGVRRLLLIGGGATVPHLASYLADRLSIEVRAAAPSDLVECPSELLIKASNPAVTVATGLARFGDA
jgi:type IV pilus assembly protein PilM